MPAPTHLPQASENPQEPHAAAGIQERLKGRSGQVFLDILHDIADENGIADLHFFPRKDTVDLSWRQDGILRSVMPLSHAQYDDVLRRIKFVSKLRLNVTRQPQDGQYSFPHEDYEVKVRVSSLPTKYGEALSLRLLDPKRGIIPLHDLGVPDEIQKQLAALVQAPHGILLVTGPTGSGKTTTLYSLLHTIVGTGRNIITLEDPIEYELPGIIQSQIDHEHEYTFAMGLRAILRQDPNVILVGEIRDQETAITAADAALTGHLVLATLHTNSAIESIARLLSMGVNTFTLAPAIRAIVAQRLLRKICPTCTGKAEGCAACLGTGYKGRMTLPELLLISHEMRDLILERAEQKVMEEQAKKEGFVTMRQWGEELVKQGVTDAKEVARVTA